MKFGLNRKKNNSFKTGDMFLLLSKALTLHILQTIVVQLKYGCELISVKRSIACFHRNKQYGSIITSLQSSIKYCVTLIKFHIGSICRKMYMIPSVSDIRTSTSALSSNVKTSFIFERQNITEKNF